MRLFAVVSCRCVEQINKANRGDLTPEEMKERQAKAMQDPEVQNILSDPVMRQVQNCILDRFMAHRFSFGNSVVMSF